MYKSADQDSRFAAAVPVIFPPAGRQSSRVPETLRLDEYRIGLYD